MDLFLFNTNIIMKNKFIVFPNADKKSKYRPPNLDNMDFGEEPYSMLLTGKPSTGKTCVIMNVLSRNTHFKKVYLVHHLIEHTKEYDDVDYEPLDYIPTMEDLEIDMDNPEPILVIIEDIDLRALDKTQKQALNRLCGCISSHCRVSVIMTVQECTQINVSIRRMLNYIIIFKCDKYTASHTSCMMGIPKTTFNNINEHILQDKHDFLLIDRDHFPRYRKNITEHINLE